MITIQDIYDKCGLVDAETFLRQKHAEAVKTASMFASADPNDVTDDQDPHGKLYRQIGATTWMAAHAAQRVIAGDHVLILTGRFSQGQPIADTIREMCSKMGELTDTHPSVTLIHWMDQKGFASSTKPPKGIPFHDEQWKERAVRRVQGPFAMTREIRYERGKYVAYAEDDEQLMTVAPDGLMDFMVKWPGIVAVGWKFDGLTAAPHGVMPVIRGALGLNVAPTKNMMWYEGNLKRSKSARPSNFAQAYGISPAR